MDMLFNLCTVTKLLLKKFKFHIYNLPVINLNQKEIFNLNLLLILQLCHILRIP